MPFSSILSVGIIKFETEFYFFTINTGKYGSGLYTNVPIFISPDKKFQLCLFSILFVILVFHTAMK